MSESLERYRHWYARLLRLYPRPYYERFAEGMEQTFGDICRAQATEHKSVFGCAVWMFAETFVEVIKTNLTFTFMQNKRIIAIVLGTAALLLIPLVGNWPWTLSDFVIMGVLLLGTGLVCEAVVRNVTNTKRRALLVLVILAVFFYIWAELAVGIFNIPGISGS